MGELKTRLAKLDHLDMDGILLVNKDMQSDPNFVYLSGVDVEGLLFYDFSKAKIFTNRRDYAIAKKGMARAEVAGKDTLERLVRNRRIGVDKTSLTADAYERLKRMKAKPVDVSSALEDARACKTKYEISCIRAACKKTGLLLRRIENQWRGLSEIEFKGLIEYEMHKLGVTPAFPTIVASRGNIAEPHHFPTVAKIKMPFLVDFGIRYKNYVSDVTRTFGSRFEPVLEKILNGLYPQIEPGVLAKDMDAFVRKSLGHYEKKFITALGHGIGIAVHEKPNLRSTSEDVLKENMVFTIEPGIYVKGGIRIENDFLLTKNGLERLTKF